MSEDVTVKLEQKNIEQLLRDKGLTVNGDIQQFHTENVKKRMTKYMPFLTGALIKQTIVQTDISSSKIVTQAPQARYLFYGKVMVDPKYNCGGFLGSDGWFSRPGVPKVLTDRNLEYTKTKNPLAGPRWDKRMTDAEGDALRADLQEYIDRK